LTQDPGGTFTDNRAIGMPYHVCASEDHMPISFRHVSRRAVLAGAASAAALTTTRAFGQTKASIKIGNINAYSGPASAYSVLGKLPDAYFRMINEQGGINGRKIVYVSYDDAYSPPKTVEQARRLVENDEVALIFGALGAPTNSAIMKYMNGKKVPQLFVASGGTKFGDPANFPWTMGFIPSYQSEGRAFAKHILATKPDAKIGVLYQNDDFGRDVLRGFKDGLGQKTGLIVAEQSYETAAPTIDSQVVAIRAAGATVFMNMTTPKFAAQAIRKIAELGWKPTHYLGNNANSITAVLKPAGLENSKDIISSAYMKDANDEAWKDDPAFKVWNGFLDKYYPDGDRGDSLTIYAYIVSEVMVQVLRQCGDDVSRENIMKQAANLKQFSHGLLLPGIAVNTSPTDYFPIEHLQMVKFNGQRYERFGSVIDTSSV
jgi:ABC-type branched-subunit amino acid transport system substrate-binding protein